MIKNVPKAVIFIGIPVLVGIILSFIGVYTGYNLRSNDFLDNHYLGMAITFWDWESFYDGFFPIGYSLLLKLLAGKSYPGPAGYYINVIALVTMFGVLGWYLRKTPLVFLLSTIGILLVPRMYLYATTPGPYAAANALFSAGALIGLYAFSSNAPENKKNCIYLCITSGGLFGIASLFRYHILVGSVFFLFSVLLFTTNKRYVFLAGSALLVAYSPQFFVNIMTGHGLLETGSALNVYNLVHGVNWYHLEKHMSFPSAWEVVQGAPFLFLKRYVRGVFDIAKFVLPVPFFILFATTPVDRRRAYALTLFMILYAAFFGIGASPRAALLVIPLSVVYLFKTVFSPKMHQYGRLGLLAASILLSGKILAQDVQATVIARNWHKTCLEIEAFLRTEGITHAQDVFTTNYELYFPHLFPYRPLFNGGWGRISTYKYSEFYPELSVDSLDSFYGNCIALGVQFIALNPDAGKLAGFLEELYEGQLVDPRFSPAYETEAEKVFQVVVPSEGLM